MASAAARTFKLDFYFDVISPYSVLAWHALRRYQPLWKSVQVNYKPFFLSGIMKGSGNQPPAMLPARAMYMTADLQRNAELFKVPLISTPNNFFAVARDVLQCQRVLVVAQVSPLVTVEEFSKLVTEIFAAIHQDPSMRDENNELQVDAKFIKHCCQNAGISIDTADTLIKQAQDPNVKNLVVENTQKALDIGAFGSPTLVISQEGSDKNHMFFGSDRFEQIAHFIGEPYYGVCPSMNGTPKL